jgi:hypothetical protein
MLGDMLSVRAAAEKPPLSTTFTKVAMLVMRSMQSPAHIAGLAELSRRFAVIKLPAITFAHILGKRECDRPGGPHCSTGSNLNKRILICVTYSENCHQAADSTTPYGTPLVFPGPALRRAERMLRHAHRMRRRSGVSLVCIGHHAAVETHALDDDGAIIGWSRLVDRRASVSARHDLVAADAVTEGIGARFHRERHGSRKRDRSDDDNRLS